MGEGDVEVAELRGEAGVELVSAGLGVEDGRVVAVVVEVAGGYEAVAAVVASGGRLDGVGWGRRIEYGF